MYNILYIPYVILYIGHVEVIYELLRFGVSIEDAGVDTMCTTTNGNNNRTGAAGGVAGAAAGGNTKKGSIKEQAFTAPILSAIKYRHVDCVRELIELGRCIVHCFVWCI